MAPEYFVEKPGEPPQSVGSSRLASIVEAAISVAIGPHGGEVSLRNAVALGTAQISASEAGAAAEDITIAFNLGMQIGEAIVSGPHLHGKPLTKYTSR